ncbi:hypothetical protein LTR37_004132 [Vermiconidia calcicola]|uniref:Uncharacterized protein n=1 Tax=Vermiconidia calcicola TaxID=1690605 RepID=A0ACC3NNK9_9PEZI|nr:hypothetical protein LTR37_004132 [Vermiconidia calcicola]
MAPITWTTTALLALATIAASKPIERRQEEDTTTDTDVEYWCTGRDLLDPEAVQALWEDSERGVGSWLAEWAEGNSNDRWADAIIALADPNIGNNGLGGCGVIGSGCAPDIDCEDWAGRGYGPHYWAIQGLVGMHDKLNVAHEYLQDETLENLMSLSEISTDFTAPSTWLTDDDLYAVLGAVFYMIGGAAGGLGLGAAAAGSAVARLGVVKAGRARTQREIDKLAPGTIKDNLQQRLDSSIASAQAMADKFSATWGATTATLGSSTYMVGGIFGVVGIGSEDAFGEVEAGDLEPALRGIFTNARSYLEQTGRLATGRADPGKGDDYEFLPGQEGVSGNYPNENPIALFYHDGGMLLGAANPTFNDTLDAAFSTMRPRIVDQALVTGKFFVFADEIYADEESCLTPPELLGADSEDPRYGSRWVEGAGCMRLMRQADTAQLCSASSENRCYYFPATVENYAAFEDKYGIDTYEYYKAAYECKINGGEERKPDLWGLPDDGTYPLCWFGIEARKGSEYCNGIDGSPGDCDINYSDF